MLISLIIEKFLGRLLMLPNVKILLILLCFFVSLLGTSPATAAQDETLTAALKAYAAKTGADFTTFEPRQTACVDLNGDGSNDALLLLQGPSWCGTGGCTLLVFKGLRDGFRFVSATSLIRGPLLVSTGKTKGWRDLIVEVSGGGMAPKKVALKYNGRKYSPNPSVLPALPKNAPLPGETVLQPKS
jgi:hypothetical protein